MRKSDPNDLKKQFFRSDDRFFQINSQWYFSAREGDIGPYRNREQARREAEAYIAARRAGNGSRRKRAGANVRAEPTVIPGYIYRSVLSMEQQVDPQGADMVLDLEGYE